MAREITLNSIFYTCALLLAKVSTTTTIETKASDTTDNNIGQFVGQLTSLLNQGGLISGPSGYPGAVSYQSGGYPGHYPPPPGPVSPYPLPPGPGGSPYPPPPPGRPFPPPPGRPFPPPGGPGGPYPPPYQQYPGGYPGQGLGAPPTSLVGALSSIARYDDLRCVPRLLCEVASGARPGSYGGYPSYQQPSPVPFLSKDALVTLLTVLNFVDDSPLLVFGRAALLGYTARGDPRACLVAYPTCPRDPDRLVDYLNNHNGGFFRFFNQQLPQYAPQYQQYQPQPPYPPPPYPHRPYPPPYPQRPYPPPGYPQQYSSQNQRYQSRIQNKPENILEYNYYMSLSTPSPLAEEINKLSVTSYKDHHQDQDFYLTKNSKSKLVFPQGNEDHQRYHRPQSSRGGKSLFFPSETPRDQPSSPLRMVFPDRTGTGDLRLDFDEYGNFKSVYYESQQHRDQREISFPRPKSTMTFPKK